MNVFIGMLQALLGRKKFQDSKPDFSDRMAKYDLEQRNKQQRTGKSNGAPSQRLPQQSGIAEDVMTNPMHPLNPLSPISVYNTHASSEPTRNECTDYGSSSSSSSHDSSSSSCDSSSSSSSSD